MKRILLIITFCIFAASSNAQTIGKKLSKPYTAKDGTVFKVGDTLRFGNGTRANGEFNYIIKPIGLTGSVVYFQPGWSGRWLPISSLRVANGDIGQVYYAIVSPAGVEFYIDLENGIKSGEIITPNTLVPKAGQPKTKAEEIKELKTLLDQGVINQAEFEKGKETILSK